MAQRLGLLLTLLSSCEAARFLNATTVKKHCAPKLNKTAILERTALARKFAATKAPDPTCKTGVLSLAGAVADKAQACCPAYCGECSDYPTCSKVRGQDSANACCLSNVLDLECGSESKPPANVCLKKCAEAVPPCIMEKGVDFKMPETSSAAEDCNEAVDEWMDKAENAIKSAKGGNKSWEELQKKGEIYNLAQHNKTVAHYNGKKKCSKKLTKAAMLQRSVLARSFAAAMKPDPTCKTGIVSMPGAIADKPQVCCPAYCGECSDYEPCKSVRGQDSTKACCASEVSAMACGGGAPANVCLKPCSEGVPPCIMPEGETFELPAETSASEDCNEAVGEYMDTVENAVKAAKGGDAAWKKIQEDGHIYNLVQKTH